MSEATHSEANMKRDLKVVFLLVVGLTVSCKDTGTGPEPGKPGKFYLEKEYVSHAWGRHVHRGMFIDTAGVVISYDVGNSEVPWHGAASELWSEEELWSKVHHNDTVLGSVPSDTLEWFRELAYASVSGRMSDTSGRGADIGLVTSSCYTLEGGHGLFRKTTLRVIGDMQYHNTSVSAIALADWLESRY
jgi:hypothetical protein